MKSFNNKNSTKQELLKKLKHHQDFDAFIQGIWLSDQKIDGNVFKGCFYGCTMQSKEENSVKEFSKQYNIDLWYCHVTEKIFEGLPNDQYQKFPYDSIEIIPVGFDLNTIKSKFFQNILKKQLEWVTNEKVIFAINKCIELFDIPFDHISDDEASTAVSEAMEASYVSRTSMYTIFNANTLAANAWAADVSVYATKAWSNDIWSADAAGRVVAASASVFASASASAYKAKENPYVWIRDILFDLINQK